MPSTFQLASTPKTPDIDGRSTVVSINTEKSRNGTLSLTYVHGLLVCGSQFPQGLLNSKMGIKYPVLGWQVTLR